MAPFHNKQTTTPEFFILAALFLLAIGMLFGLTGMFQYIQPGFLKSFLSFEKVRPLHVSAVVFWIILAAAGSVLTYLQEHTGSNIKYPLLAKFHLLLFLSTIVLILGFYCAGIFGGREYWEFPPVLAAPIAIGWILLLVNFISSVGTLKHQPVYVWMWLTGCVFFLFTFLESYLWVFPYFRNNVINDMTIQWKSYGSMVGAWNMLIYGCSIYLMQKITGNKTLGYSPMAFVLYFTGLFNLMFNWGHHIYTLPTHAYIKHISYLVSMTELFIFGRIIYTWRSTVSEARRHSHIISYQLLTAADLWIFMSLLLAICMSVPAINVYTHGTHVTVAHTMGTTIGINSFLLLAFVFDIFGSSKYPHRYSGKRFIKLNWVVNTALFIFWFGFIVAGYYRARWQMHTPREVFSTMMQQLRPAFIVICIAGFFVMTGILGMLYPLIKTRLQYLIRTKQ